MILDDPQERVWECGVGDGDELRVLYEPRGGVVMRKRKSVRDLAALYEGGCVGGGGGEEDGGYGEGEVGEGKRDGEGEGEVGEREVDVGRIVDVSGSKGGMEGGTTVDEGRGEVLFHSEGFAFYAEFSRKRTFH
ncbi:hypothetical protein HDV00_003059 [Rhizophlyctis rosea]|nr:hypothetical protein HDV00_003059 [Rhizophlyctis rosea]